MPEGFLTPLTDWVVLQAGGVSSTQLAFGLVVILLAATYTAFLLIRGRDQGLPEEQRVVRDQIRGALDEGYVTKRFDAEAIRARELTAADLAEELRALFERESVEEPETVREAGGEIRAAFGETWREKTEWLPSHALALGEWALAVLVFGTIAVATSVIVSALGVSAGRPSLGEVLSTLGDAVSTGIDWIFTALGLFPFADLLLSLGLAYGILLVELLYQNPWALAGVMLAVAIVLLALELRIDLPANHDRTEAVGARLTATALLGSLLLVWAAGTAVRLALRPVFALADAEVGASLVGLLVALLAVIWLLVGTKRWLGRRIRRATRDVEAPRRALIALVTLRVLASILRPVGILASIAYLVVVLVSGRLATVLEAYLTAAVEVKLSVAGLGLLILIAFLWELRDAAPRVRQAIAEVWARERVRIGIAARSIPYMGVIFAFLILTGLQLPVMLAIIAAALVGLLFRIVVSKYLQARRRYAEREGGELLPSSLVVGARSVETVAGSVYLLSVADTVYAHDRLEPLLEAGVDALEQRAREGTADPTIEEWYFRNLRQFGLYGYEQTYRVETDRATGTTHLAGKLPERIRKRVLAHLREQPGRKSSRERLIANVCGDLPDAVVRRRLAEMIVAGGLREHADGTVVLKTDIWALDPGTESAQAGQSRGSAGGGI